MTFEWHRPRKPGSVCQCQKRGIRVRHGPGRRHCRAGYFAGGPVEHSDSDPEQSWFTARVPDLRSFGHADRDTELKKFPATPADRAGCQASESDLRYVGNERELSVAFFAKFEGPARRRHGASTATPARHGVVARRNRTGTVGPGGAMPRTVTLRSPGAEVDLVAWTARNSVTEIRRRIDRDARA